MRVLGDAPIPVLVVAVYGDGMLDPEAGSVLGIPTVAIGRRSPAIPLDAHGRYRIAADDPLPSLLIVCSLQPTGWGQMQGLHVVGTLLAGESLELRTGSIELRASTPEVRGDPVVTITMPTEALRHPVQTAHANRRHSWSPSHPLLLHAVPVAVRSIVVDGRSLPVEVRAGAVTRIDIELGAQPTASDGR